MTQKDINNRFLKKPPANARDLVINVTFNLDNTMQFSISRACAAVELASIALAIVGSQIQVIAQDQLNANSQQGKRGRDRTQPHEYETNLDSEKSVRGFACGLCGDAMQSGVHRVPEVTGETHGS